MHAQVPALSSLAALQAAFTLVFVLLTLSPNVVLAQTPVNGQIYTNGLSIINAPALNSFVSLFKHVGMEEDALMLHSCDSENTTWVVTSQFQ